MDFRGSIVPIVTPFKNGEINREKLRELIEFHIENGTDGIVPCGTTGESATLTHEEHREIIKLVVEAVAKRIPVIAGVGSNCTRESIEFAKYAELVGADGALSITPYYNKPTQEGLYAHFRAISNSISIPIILYNVPSRTAVNITPETVCKLVEDCPNIVGIKEATGDMKQQSKIMDLCHGRITLLSGDDFTVLPTLSIGGKGVISAVANVAPSDMANLIRRFEEGNLQEAISLQYKLLPLCEAMFIETNPVPVKEALAMMGIISPEVRLPLVPLIETNREKVRNVLRVYELIK